MRLLAGLAALVLAVLAFDRLALWAEGRGWIYWRRRKASPGTLGGALLEVQRLVEPGQRHLAEAREERPEAAEESGAPPEGEEPELPVAPPAPEGIGPDGVLEQGGDGGGGARRGRNSP